MKQVIVVGGGPSGVLAALYSRRDDVIVTVIDKNKEPLKKLLLTGNGRCNFWNKDQNLKHFHSKREDVIKEIFTEKNLNEVYNYILKMGIVPFYKDNYAYPYSMQANTMKYALLEEAKQKNIVFKAEEEVLSIKKSGECFVVESTKGKYMADAVILATGSKAYPKTGSDGSGYDISLTFHHSIVDVHPSLVGLEMKEPFLRDFAGVRTQAHVTLYEDGKKISEESGEIQLNDTGISGICIFNISREVSIGLSKHKKEVVKINFMPFTNSVLHFLEKQNEKVTNRDIGSLLEVILNYKLVNVILKRCKIKREETFSELSSLKKQELASMIAEFPCEITGTKGFEYAQVCSGGIDLEDVYLDRMESKIVDGLFFAGELLDVDGDCGGYNLENAFVSGMLAGKGVLKKFTN